MENNLTNIAQEPKTEEFDFSKHFTKAALGSLYYLVIYVPFLLPYKIWGKSAVRVSNLWDNKAIGYREQDKNYPLFYFYFNYTINLLFDAVMFLSWPLGFLYLTYDTIDNIITLYDTQNVISTLFTSYIINLFYVYFSVLALRLGKEVLFFILNELIIWLLEVVKNIGKLIKNMWLLNFVYKKKEDK